MTKRELVMAVLAGREANRVPLAVTTQTSPRNYPGSCSQRAPIRKNPKVVTGTMSGPSQYWRGPGGTVSRVTRDQQYPDLQPRSGRPLSRDRRHTTASGAVRSDEHLPPRPRQGRTPDLGARV